jgi:hypothetical protein
VATDVIATARKAVNAPVGALDSLGEQLSFYLRALAWTPRTIKRYKKEVMRLLSEVVFGSGSLAVIGGTVGVITVLCFFTGTEVGLQGYAALDQLGIGSYSGFVSAYFNTREIAPLVAALALAATVGCGFTAQLGAMRISEEPVVKQFLNGRREGPIGMSEEKDSAQVAAELAALDNNEAAPLAGVGPKGAQGTGVPPQIQPSPGIPERKAVARRQARVMEMLHTLPDKAQEAIKKLMDEEHEIEEAARAESQRRQSDRGNGQRPQPSPTPDQGHATVGTGGSA